MHSEIKVKVMLDETKVPEKLYWSAIDANIQNKETKAALISVWDDNEKEALRIDLWTKKMPLEEMKEFIRQVFFGLGETYVRATSDKKGGQEIHAFAQSFQEEVKEK